MWQHTNASVRIAVRDRGPGISPADQEKLFRPYERLGRTHSTGGGTGLGLALARRLTEAMGGTIGVESTLGQGATFWITLPRAGDIAQESAPAA